MKKTITESHPTLSLRYVYKDGRYVLQQKWMTVTYNKFFIFYGSINSAIYEWRDVPTADETQP